MTAIFFQPVKKEDESKRKVNLPLGFAVELHMGGADGKSPHPDGSPQKVHGTKGGQKAWVEAQEKKSDITKSPAFKKWFGKSKVVDENGKPLVVYHGTNEEVSVFSKGQNGYFFTAKKEFAGEYAKVKSQWKGGEGANVISAYLKLEKPMIVDREFVENFAKEVGFSNPKEEADSYFYSSSPLRDSIFDWVKQEGHDGYIIKGDLMPKPDGGGFVVPDDTYVVFSPTQIKSRFNSGNFDSANPNIALSERRSK